MHSIVLTITISLLLLLIATIVYPGGSLSDKNSIGFDWTKNFITNFLGAKAGNGSDNPSRIWAVSGIFFLSVSFVFFYYQFSERIPSKLAKNIIKYAGSCSVLFAFLAVTPYHDTMVTIAIILSMISVFYVTTFTFQTKLHFHKIACCICLLALYFVAYIYYSGLLWNILPIMQKIQLVISVTWMLSLQYFSTADDFKPKKEKA